MRLVTFEIAGQPRPGVLAGDGIIDLQPLGADLRAILQGGSLERIRSMLKSAPTPIPAKSARLLAPIQNPGMVLSCGMRSEEHTSELQSRLHLVCRLLLEKKKKNDGQLTPRVLPCC